MEEQSKIKSAEDVLEKILESLKDNSCFIIDMRVIPYKLVKDAFAEITAQFKPLSVPIQQDKPFGYVFGTHFYKEFSELDGLTFHEGNKPHAVYLYELPYNIEEWTKEYDGVGQAVLPISDEEKEKAKNHLWRLINALEIRPTPENYKPIEDFVFSQSINTISDATDYKTLYEREVECVDFMKNVEKEYLAEIERLKKPVSIVSHLIENCNERIISIDKVITEPDVKFARINEVETFKKYLEIIQTEKYGTVIQTSKNK